MGNIAVKMSPVEKAENDLCDCGEKNKKLQININSLKTQIESLKESEAPSVQSKGCKEKVSSLRKQMTSVLATENKLKEQVYKLKKKLEESERDNQKLKTASETNNEVTARIFEKENEDNKKLIKILYKSLLEKKGKIRRYNRENYILGKEVDSLREANRKYKKESLECENKYDDLKKEYEIFVKYRDFTVHNETKVIKLVPENRYSLKINNVDVHPSGFAKITYHFIDGKSDTFKFRGSEGLEFIDCKNVSKRLGVGNHSTELNNYFRHAHIYTILCSNITSAITWEFKSLSGVNKIVLYEKSSSQGLKNICLSRDIK